MIANPRKLPYTVVPVCRLLFHTFSALIANSSKLSTLYTVANPGRVLLNINMYVGIYSISPVQIMDKPGNCCFHIQPSDCQPEKTTLHGSTGMQVIVSHIQCIDCQLE